MTTTLDIYEIELTTRHMVGTGMPQPYGESIEKRINNWKRQDYSSAIIIEKLIRRLACALYDLDEARRFVPFHLVETSPGSWAYERTDGQGFGAGFATKDDAQSAAEAALDAVPFNPYYPIEVSRSG